MAKRYQPTSDFLKAVIADDVPLSGSELADTTLRQLIQMMRDEDRSNRDWATFLLALEDVDTTAVRDALLHAASDDDEYVRAEAIYGLAQRDRSLALPFVQKALLAEFVAVMIFRAAELCAHPSLVESLRAWVEPSDDPDVDQLAADALAACESAANPDLR